MSTVRFRAPDNPNYNIASQALFEPIFFENGVFETDDPTEIDLLRKAAGVIEEPRTTSEAAAGEADPKPPTPEVTASSPDSDLQGRFREGGGNSASGGEGQSS